MLTLLELVALGIAAYRATYLAVHDTITDPLRNHLNTWHAHRPASRIRTAIITLTGCTYCTGWWISGALLAIYLTATSNWHTGTGLLLHGVEWFTVAGTQALLNRWDDSRDPA